ncbi:MBL fold metallo-hydrolase [Candidatus Bipolaricaulota bacterium]|nr:MBL fold metallo-hydrolase [Candidatus Bipolaricaulota bacterium]
MTSASYRFQLGEFELLIVKDGTGGQRPLSDLVDDLPQDLIQHEIFMEGGLMVVDTPEVRFLIDAGNGPHRRPRTHMAEQAFDEEGITPQSIDTILLTHGDPDHISGLLTKEGELVYPNAHYVLNIDLWRALSSDLEAGLVFAGQIEFVHRLADLIQGRSTLLEAEREIWPGVRAIPALGHRAGHTIYRFDSHGSVLFHIGDAAFDPIFLERPELTLPTEYKPKQARSTRAAIARRLTTENALIVGSHFAVSNVGRLKTSDEGHHYHWIQQSPGQSD